MIYLVHILNMAIIFSILALSLNLLSGYSGMLSICHAVFYGFGAYSAALLTSNLSLPWILVIVLVPIAGAVFGLTVGRAALKFKGDYFVLATFSLQIVFSNVVENWSSLTGGVIGLSAIKPPSFAGVTLGSPQSFLFPLAFVLGVTVFVVHRISNSPFGRVLRGIREDELFCLSLGKDVISYRRCVFAVGAALAALAGCMFSAYRGYIDPTSFSIQESIFILAIVIIGGRASLLGPIAGATFLVVLPEVLRYIGIESSVAAIVRQLLYGIVLVVIILYRPQGLLGEHSAGSSGGMNK